MRPRSVITGISAGCVLLVLTLVASATRAPERAQAMPAEQPAATATVEARQTATAVTRATVAAQPQPPATPEADSSQSNLVVPENRGFNPSRLSQLSVPAGFWVNVFAQGLGNVRMLVAGADGTLYATRREQGDVIALSDSDGDGRADQTMVIASDLPYINGIALHGNQLYLATDHKVLVGDLEDDHTLSGLKTIIDDLPDAGQHPNRTLAIGLDGMLYITVGSTCNACNDTNPKNATILRANRDGSGLEIFATGLRNTIGFGWNPSSGQLWGFDHGSDGRGDNQPPEELNLLRPNGNFGWPYCFANQQPDSQFSQDPPGTTKAAYCPTTLPPILTYQAHSAPLGMVFYTGAQFPQAYQGDAFVAMHGSWNRQPATGYKVVRVRFQNGWPVAIEDFMTGFLIEDGAAHFGRPAGIALAPYGSLFVSDDANGVIYRISWSGTG